MLQKIGDFIVVLVLVFLGINWLYEWMGHLYDYGVSTMSVPCNQPIAHPVG